MQWFVVFAKQGTASEKLGCSAELLGYKEEKGSLFIYSLPDVIRGKVSNRTTLGLFRNISNSLVKFQFFTFPPLLPG